MLRDGSAFKFPSGELFDNIIRVGNEEMNREAIEEAWSLS